MFRILFSNLAEGLKLDRCTIPSCVSTNKDPDDYENHALVIQNQEKLLSLPESTKDKLTSPKTGKEIRTIGERFNLELLQLADIARAIRSFYFNELRAEDFSSYIAKEIPIDPETAQKITRMVFQKIINDDSQEKAAQAQIEKLPLPSAITRYPEIGEQIITSDRITLKNFPEAVRPSVKNWLSDYTFTMGFDPHDSTIRATYLFQNKNTRDLNSQDQKKLSHLLRAFDTNENISINIVSKEIIFPQEEAPKKNMDFKPLSVSMKPSKQEERSLLAKHTPIEFTSPQKMPFEKEEAEEPFHGLQPIKITPRNFQPNPPHNNSSNFKKQV